MASAKLVTQLKAFRREVNKEIPLRKMILFGSRAWGKPTKHSDVDLILVSPKFKGKRWLNRSPDLYLKWNLKYPVDFLCYTPEEFERKKKQFGIVKQAANEGIVI